jgi:dCTP deaminase
MILCDREFRAALARYAIRITPDPRRDPILSSSTALDLRLGDRVSVWDFSRPGAPNCFSPADPDHNLLDLTTRFTQTQDIPETGVLLERGAFLLGWTLQTVQMPYRSRLAARVEGKSSLARLGMGVHVTAPTIHAGFGYNDRNPNWIGNPIQLEIWNTGPMPIVLKRGMAICQLIFEWVDGTPEQGYHGQFRDQGPPPPPTEPLITSPKARKRRRP